MLLSFLAWAKFRAEGQSDTVKLQVPKHSKPFMLNVSRLGLVVRRPAGRRTDPGSTLASHLPLHKLWFVDAVSIVRFVPHN